MSTPESQPPKSSRRRAERKAPRPLVATPIQLDVKPSIMLVRGLFGRCPVCGSRHLFRRWVSMVDDCPQCSLHFERVDGHWIGGIGVNTVCVMGLMLIVLATVTFSFYPDSPPVGPLLTVEIIIAVLGPIVFFPASRTLWTAIDLLMTPLRPGEVDPRFVVVDPERDGTTAPVPRSYRRRPPPPPRRR